MKRNVRILFVLGLCTAALASFRGVLADSCTGTPVAKFHGLGVAKSAVSPINVGDTYQFSASINNNLDTALDTLLVFSLDDAITTAGGVVTTGDVLEDMTWSFFGGASCDFSVPNSPVCTLPAGGSMISDPYDTGIVSTLADFNLDPINHQVNDTLTITWRDTCCDGLCSTNCNAVNDQLATAPSATFVVNPQPCCLEDGSCVMVNDCEGQGGTVVDQCSPVEGCCFSDNTCQDLAPECCELEGGTPQGSGTACDGTEACCLDDGTCVEMDPLCCDEAGGSPQGPGSTCGGAVEGCCFPDNTCQDLDATCCEDQGGTPQGPGSACNGTEACCLEDGTCVEMDPLCCDEAGGSPQGPGSTCGGALEGCCFPDNTCQDLDATCCADQGGTPQGSGTECNGIEACCLPDGSCQEMDPLCCLEEGGVSQGPGSVCETTTCGGGEGCTPGYWKLIDISNGKASHQCNWGVSPNTCFEAIFNCPPLTSGDTMSDCLTLHEALNLGGGGFKALARHGTAAYLNSLSDDVDYEFDTTAVVNMVNGACANPGTVGSVHGDLAEQNETCCPIGNCKCSGTNKLCDLSGAAACSSGVCENNSDGSEDCDARDASASDAGERRGRARE